MPRAESKALSGQLYQSQYPVGPYSPDSPVSPQSDRQHPQSSSSPTSSALSAAVKKKHICPTCDRAFTTSGHLARHSRVHTGERNHKCPFPGCETRCSRQDNLQQHYRIHLSPGSRRSSTRSAIARAMNPSSSPSKRNSVSSPELTQMSPPPMSPPALEPARIYTTHSPPPDTPPALEPATLPVAMHIADPVSSRSSSSPDNSYSPANHHLLSMQSNSTSLPGSQSYSYRSGTTTYQEQSQGAGFTYVHTTPIHSTSNSASNFSYSNAHGSFGNHSLPHMNSTAAVIHNARHNSESSISGMTSRHSISHISHPHSYSQGQSSSGGPPSPASSHSVSSHTSGPPTPTYSVFHGDGHYHADGLMSHEANNHQSMGVPSHILHSNSMYHHNGSHSQSSSGAITLSGGRFVDSPPPVLAPIQDERYIRRDDRHSTQSHSSSPYIHHPQPLSSDYPYSQQIGLPTGWKSENSLRKGVGALVQ